MIGKAEDDEVEQIKEGKHQGGNGYRRGGVCDTAPLKKLRKLHVASLSGKAASVVDADSEEQEYGREGYIVKERGHIKDAVCKILITGKHRKTAENEAEPLRTDEIVGKADDEKTKEHRHGDD